MATATKARRKYQFRTREAAESAYRSVSQSEHNLIRGLRAMYTGRVCWLRTDGAYRVGLFDENSPGEPKVLLVFAPKGTRQEPSVCAYSAYEWARETYDSLTRVSPTSDDGLSLRHLAGLVLESLGNL